MADNFNDKNLNPNLGSSGNIAGQTGASQNMGQGQDANINKQATGNVGQGNVDVSSSTGLKSDTIGQDIDDEED